MDVEIEKEINQAKFRNEFHRMFVNLIYTGNWFAAHNTRMLRPFGLSMQQYNILRILRGQHPGPVTVNLLTERMLDKMSNASRLVEKLRLKGLVERRQCEQDRRAVDVVITDSGLELLKEVDRKMIDWEDNFNHLSENEARQLNTLLNKLRG